MKIRKLIIASNRILVSFFACFLLTTVAGSSVFSQEKKVVKNTGSSVIIITYKEIPEATETCAPAECEWWKQLRQAGNDLQRKGDGKSKRKFILLFVEGLEKSYRVPLKDRPPQVLAGGRMEFADLVKRTIIGGTYVPVRKKVVLTVEYRADGSVGEVKVIEGLDTDVNNRVIQANRQNIFLPAIKDGAFVTDWQKVGTEFSN